MGFEKLLVNGNLDGFFCWIKNQIFSHKLTEGVKTPTIIGAKIPMTDPQLLTIAIIVGA
jgi:hypothetical protein